MWLQRQITLRAKPRGFHLITDEVLREIPELHGFRVGLLHVFMQHTSASLTINENADPDVRRDFEMAANRLVPDTWDYVHTLEGADDMPAHIKGALMGFSLSIPIREGALAMGTWQGIYQCEHRDHGGQRRLMLTMQGEG